MNDLKEQILSAAEKSIVSAIHASMTSYSSPLTSLAKEVVEQHSDELKAIMAEAMNISIKSPEFKEMIKEEFKRKIAKNLVAKLEGTVEKAAEKLKQDQTMKARMILAIEKIVNEA